MGLFQKLVGEELVWFPEKGLGYFPVKVPPYKVYDQEYFKKYEGYAETEMGQALNVERVSLVSRYAENGAILDIGIGSGTFVTSMPNAFGYDVNPFAIEWLAERHLYSDPFWETPAPSALTFWDSFEHIQDFEPYLSLPLCRYIFVSCPIFRNAAHVLRSKHFRKDEHFWYFTSWGLAALMKDYGYRLVEYSDIETQLGREDIGTFVFVK